MSNNQYQHASAPTAVSSVVGVGSTDGGTSGVGHDSGGDGVEGEEQEESSSSSHGTSERPKEDDELTIFREQWQRELETALPDQKQGSDTSLWKDASNREDKGSNKENERQPAEPPPPFPPPTRPPSYRLPPLLTIHFLVPPCRERDATREAELHRRLGELATKHAGQQKQWQAQMCQMQEAAQKKINHLLQLLEESHQQCENCKSRPEDTQLIADLRKIVSEKDRELASLTEEKRFYQMELVNRETNNNRLFNSQPIVGVMDALQHRRCKGSSGGCAPSNKANSKQITLVTSSHLPSPVSDSVVQRSHSMDLQELVFSVPSDRCQSLDSSVSLPLPSANSTNNECSLQPDTVP